MLNFDLTNAPDGIKGVLVNIFVLPFWYIVIYLFHPKFFLSNDLLLVLAFCLCFTIVSGLMMAYLSFFSDKSKPEIFSSYSAVGGVILQITLHCLLILIILGLNYLTGQELGLKMYLFFFFGVLTVFLIAAFRGFRRSHKTNQTSPEKESKMPKFIESK